MGKRLSGLQCYLRRMRRSLSRPGSAVCLILREALVAALGSALTVALLYLLSFDVAVVSCFVAPFGASCALVFGVPTAPFSQPRSVIFGHCLSALLGVTVAVVFGRAVWWTVGMAAGMAVAVMVVTQTLHPPAAVTAFLPLMMGIRDFKWVLYPVGLGTGIVVMVGLLYNNIYADRHYPIYWW